MSALQTMDRRRRITVPEKVVLLLPQEADRDCIRIRPPHYFTARAALHGTAFPLMLTVPSIRSPLTRPVYAAPPAVNVI